MPFKPMKYPDPQHMTRDEMVREIKQLRGDCDMYANAWLRELGGKIFRKSHAIDGLVLTTRWMRERSDRLAVIEAEGKFEDLQSEYGPTNLTSKAREEYIRNLRTLPPDSVAVLPWKHGT